MGRIDSRRALRSSVIIWISSDIPEQTYASAFRTSVQFGRAPVQGESGYYKQAFA